MNLLQELIKETLLLEAKENAEFLIKLNYDILKKEQPDLHPRELHKLAKEGPVYTKHIINSINDLKRPGGYERYFIKWLGDVMPSVPSYGPHADDINYIYDWYLGDENAKNEMNYSNFHDAQNKAEEWHWNLKDKSFDTDIKDEGKTKVVYKFPNGSKIVELSWEDCEAEGTSMGHCVGTLHTKLVEDGKEKIFSLRSETNKPHVTISVDANTNQVLEIKGRENKIPVQKHAKLVKEWLKTTNLEYTLCNDYFNILSTNEKKEMLQTEKENGIDNFFVFIFEIFIHKMNLSQQDFIKIAIGAAKSCTHLIDEIKTVTKALSIAEDCAIGKVSHSMIGATHLDLTRLYKEKYDLREPLSAVIFLLHAAKLDGRASGFLQSIIRAANTSGISKQEILNSIEKEIKMPLEDFLFKNENQEINESLIKSFINAF